MPPVISKLRRKRTRARVCVREPVPVFTCAQVSVIWTMFVCPFLISTWDSGPQFPGEVTMLSMLLLDV